MIDISEAELDCLARSLKEALVVLGRIKKRRNARASVAKAKARGTKMGRPKKRNDEAIQKLRDRGFSYRKIAKFERISTTAVQRALKAVAK